MVLSVVRIAFGLSCLLFLVYGMESQINPTSSFSKGYLEYIKSKEWRKKRVVALIRANGFCERCGKQSKLQVHHRHYRTLFNEGPDDLKALCSRCHPVMDYTRKNKGLKVPKDIEEYVINVRVRKIAPGVGSANIPRKLDKRSKKRSKKRRK